MNDSILQVRNLNKTIKNGSMEVVILNDLSFEVKRGATCALVGPSGSGKTTLLGLCAGLDDPSSGQIVLDGRDLADLSEDKRAAFRRERIGFVFQNFQLLPTLTAIQNVLVPLELQGKASKAREAAQDLLNRVGLGHRLDHYPLQLSGGEQQRVALARAFIHQPSILFADEPTGNLDSESSEKIEEMIFELNRERGASVVLVTHDDDLARRAQQCIRLEGGRMVSQNQAKTKLAERRLPRFM